MTNSFGNLAMEQNLIGSMCHTVEMVRTEMKTYKRTAKMGAHTTNTFKMNEHDIKLFLLNTTAMTISMAQVETVLKLSLLLVSIGYTVQRWYYLHKNKGK